MEQDKGLKGVHIFYLYISTFGFSTTEQRGLTPQSVSPKKRTTQANYYYQHP